MKRILCETTIVRNPNQLAMKNLNRLAVFVFTAAMLYSCGATHNLTMNATAPAPVTLSSNVKRIGVLNRSLPSEGNKIADQIDKVLSVEGKQLDSLGSEAALHALVVELGRNHTIEEAVLLDDMVEFRKGLGIFPARLSDLEVAYLCETYGVDALFSLEFYDTNTQVNYETVMINVPNNLGIKVAVPGHKLRLDTQIKNGWRIYDLNQADIMDQFILQDQVVSVGSGINPVEAYRAIAGRKEAVLENSMRMGSNYAYRIQPYQRRVSRQYFVRGTDKFKIAMRRAQAGQWNDAALLWEEETLHNDSKIAGRACYNMAIINEINGNLDQAIDWASRSYTDYENRLALNYLSVLRNRKRQQQVLEHQLSR